MLTKKKLATVASSVTALLLSSTAFAQEGAMGGGANAFDVQMAAAFGASLAIALAAVGGALGQGKTAAAALEGISRNPGAASRIQTPMILGLALIESLVLFAFAVSFLLYSKIP